MDYKNPLHIIRDKDLSSITPDNLKSWKKELMLRFNLGRDTTIKVNGKEYDKQGVIEAFEAMRGDLPLHARILQKPDLLDFLEEGNLRFFDQDRATKIVGQSDFTGEIRSLFIKKIGHVYRKTFTFQSQESLYEAITLQKFTRSLSTDERSECFTLAFIEIQRVLDGFQRLNSAPFVEDFKCKLKTQYSNYLNRHICRFIQQAPTEFADLREEYSLLAFSIVYEIYGERKVRTGQLHTETLKILQIAVIASLWTQQHGSNGTFLFETGKIIQKIIRAREQTAWERYGESFLFACFLICFSFLCLYNVLGTGGHRTEETTIPQSELVMVDDDFWLKNMQGWYNYQYVFAGYDISDEFFFRDNGKGALVIFARKNGKVMNIICADFDWRIVKGSWFNIKQKDTEILLSNSNFIQEKLLESFKYKNYSKRIFVSQKVSPDKFFSGKKIYKSFAASNDRLLELRKIYSK